MKKILTLLVSVLMIIGLCGCGGPTPTETADAFLNAVKAEDGEALKTVYGEEALDLMGDADEDALTFGDLNELGEGGKIFKEKLLDFDYTLSNEKIDGDKATVDVQITTYSFGDMFSSFMTEYFNQALMLAFSDVSEEEVEKLGNEIFLTKVNELKEKDYTGSATINLVKKDDAWVVEGIEDEELINALTGDMLKSFERMEEAYSFDE